MLSPPRCVLCIVISLYGNQLTNTNSITRITLNTKPELRQRLESLRDRLKPLALDNFWAERCGPEPVSYTHLKQTVMILFEREMVVAHGRMPSPAPKTNTNMV